MTFIGEDGRDNGGLLREFFTVVFEDVKKYLVCCGKGDGYTFHHDMERLKRHEFLLLGRLFGLAIVYGCPGPRYLLPPVVSKIFFQPTSYKFYIQDIPDFDIQTKLNKVANATSDEEFQKSLEEFPERFDAVSKAKVNFCDKDVFIQDVVEHYTTSKCSEEIFDIAAGLDFANLHAVLSSHLEVIFCELSLGKKSKPTAKDVIKMFATRNYHEESEIKNLQEDFYYNLTNYIQALEEKPYNLECAITLDEEIEIKQKKEIFLSDFLQFMTSSRFVLATMFQKFQIDFILPTDCKKGQRLFVSTCQLSARIPLNQHYCTDTESFNKNISEDIINSPGFGKE